MSQYDPRVTSESVPPSFSTPPTEPPPAPFDEAKRWPKVVGIISIVWAALGLICTACGVAGMFMNSQGPNGQPLPAEFRPSPLQLGVMGIGAVLALMLLVAGIMLVSRKRAARPVFIVYSVLAIIVGAVGMYAAVKQQQALSAWMAANPTDEMAKMMAKPAMKAIQGTIMIVSVLLSFGWPLFCLAWFGMVKRNAAEIDAGVDDSVV